MKIIDIRNYTDFDKSKNNNFTMNIIDLLHKLFENYEYRSRVFTIYNFILNMNKEEIIWRGNEKL